MLRPTTKHPNFTDWAWTAPYRRRIFTVDQRIALWEMANGLCHYCGQFFPFDQSQADHVFPFSRGGASVLANGVNACGPCNRHRRHPMFTPYDAAGMFFRRIHGFYESGGAVWDDYYYADKTTAPLAQQYGL